MMDDFGLYPREEAFDPLGVMLFKALQVIAFLFFLALLAVSPDAKDGKIDSKAEFLITMDWPDNHPDDFDLFVQDPAGNIAWYRRREAGFLTLDRDDRGGANDFIVVNGKKILSPVPAGMLHRGGVGWASPPDARCCRPRDVSHPLHVQEVGARAGGEDRRGGGPAKVSPPDRRQNLLA